MDSYGLANNIKKLRKRKGITQVELAKMLDLSKHSIISYEKGTTYPSSDILEKMMIIFNVSPNELFHIEKADESSTETKIKELEIYKEQVLNEFTEIQFNASVIEYEEPIYDSEGEIIDYKNGYISAEEQARNYLIKSLNIEKASDNLLKKIFEMIIDEEINKIESRG